MYGPYGAPGMRTRQPADSDEDEEDGDLRPRTPSTAISSTVLPHILHIIPRLKLPSLSDASTAAHELVEITNTTSAAEDDLVGETELLGALVHLLRKGNVQGRVNAACAIANLTNKSHINKVRVAKCKGALLALVSMSEAPTDQERSSGARVLVGLATFRETAEAMVATDGCIPALASLVLTANMAAKEDGCKAFDVIAAHSPQLAYAIGSAHTSIQALKSSARSVNCSLRARVHSVSSLHTLSRCKKLHEILMRYRICEEVFLPILSDDSLGRFAGEMHLLATMGASHLAHGPDDISLCQHVSHVAAMVPALAATVNPQGGGGRGREEPRLSRRSSHILRALCLAAMCDELKVPILEARALELSMDLITVAHKGGQRGACLREISCFVLTLSVDKGAQERMRLLDYPSMLRAHTLGPDPAIRNLCRAALWCLGDRWPVGEKLRAGHGVDGKDEELASRLEQGKGSVFFLFHGDDEERVRRVACAVAKEGYMVSPSKLLEPGGDKESRRRGGADISAACAAEGTLCVCISASFNGCSLSRVASSAAEESGLPIIPLLFDHTKPARHLKGVAPLLACIDFIDDQSFGLGMMELFEEISCAQQAGESHSLAAGGFGAAAMPPTIAFTNLGGASLAGQHCGNGVIGLSPRSSSQTSHAHSWEGYDTSFMHGGKEEEESEISWSASNKSSLWNAPGGDQSDSEYSEEGEENVPLDKVASIITSEVLRRTLHLSERMTVLSRKLEESEKVINLLRVQD